MGEINTPLLPQVHALPDGGTWAEVAINGDRVLKSCTKISGVSVLPNSAIVQMLCSLANQTRPQPQGRMGRNAVVHLQLIDLFFPDPFMLEEGRDYYEFRKAAPNMMVCQLMGCSKENGELEAKNLMEGVKLA